MLRPLLKRLRGGLSDALLTALAGFGLSLLLLTALLGQANMGLLAVACGVPALLICLSKAVSPRACVGLLAAAFALLALGCLNIGPLAAAAQPLRVFMLYPDLLGSALPPYRIVLNILLPVLLTSLCAIAVLIDVPTLTLLPMALLSIVFGTELIGNTAAPALIGAGACTGAYLLALGREALFMMPGKEQLRLSGWRLLIALTAFAVCYAFMPRALPNAPRLRRAAEEAYQTVSDYLPSSDESARSGFTLETEGYLPLGSEQRPRLGGPADPPERAVMEVQADRALYLRGVIMNSYNGLNWQDTLSGRRFLYADLLQQGYRRSLFDEYLPLTGESLTMHSASVHMQAPAATTLYVPQRIRSLELRSGRMTPYFNAASELFLTRELAAGDGYAFTYLSLPADSERTARLVEEAAAVADTRYAEVAQTYTALPSHLSRELYSLSFEAAGGEETPYRRALAIRDYLRGHYTYDLNVSTPPDNVDFAAWFLLREKRGYCTYFATALTILCRMQGIPARYVTGYLAVPVDGLASVTSMDAHAWTEVYLNGFGWLTLDATPGHGEDDPDEDGGSTSPEGHNDEPPVTPTPEPSPTPEPDDGPGEQETTEPDAPTPTPEPRETETPEPDAEPPERPHGNTWLLLILLLLLVTALLLTASVLMDPERRAKRRPRQAAEILVAAVDAGMEKLYRPRRAGETVIEYYTAAGERFPDLPLAELADAYSARVYGHKPLRPELPLTVWQRLRDRLSFPQRVGVILSGIFPAGK